MISNLQSHEIGTLLGRSFLLIAVLIQLLGIETAVSKSDELNRLKQRQSQAYVQTVAIDNDKQFFELKTDLAFFQVRLLDVASTFVPGSNTSIADAFRETAEHSKATRAQLESVQARIDKVRFKIEDDIAMLTKEIEQVENRKSNINVWFIVLFVIGSALELVSQYSAMLRKKRT